MRTNFNCADRGEEGGRGGPGRLRHRHGHARRALERPDAGWPRPKSPTTARWWTTTCRSSTSTSARARCWSTMASTWPKGRGPARPTSTPAAVPASATPACTSTTASRSRRSSAAARTTSSRRADRRSASSKASRPKAATPELVPTPEPGSQSVQRDRTAAAGRRAIARVGMAARGRAAPGAACLGQRGHGGRTVEPDRARARTGAAAAGRAAASKRA